MAHELNINRWDLECSSNNLDHHTYLNGVDRLIVRRGQPFMLRLYLHSGKYQPGVTTLHCIAETGPKPSDQYGTRASFDLSTTIDTSCWSAAVTSSSEDKVVLSICPAPDAPIGHYRLTLGHSATIGFILLFNPWCPGDAVYMDNEQNLDEYVLCQDGIIFQGSPEYLKPMAWNFGQFESGILDICLKILDMNPKCLKNPGKDYSGRRNPIYVSRVISAMVNCNDDKGVLLGNWSNKYEGGVSPMFWRGSVEILQKWDELYCQPVKYGQCWVFAAVACSVSRALGIPCRVITNFLSAHDTNSNLTIERYVSENGEPLQSRDSIWNFHCWVESWMSRPDLKPSFDGWQASDPTPQEKSDGVFCCGPVSVKAIKEGELQYKYDAPFVFAEVNADINTIVKKKDGTTLNLTETTRVGQNISTKSVGHDAREDITHLYKYPEGSAQEREAFKRACKKSKEQPNQGLQLSIKVGSDVKKGCDFDVFAVVTNNTSSEKTCRLTLHSLAVSYNGFRGGNCGSKNLLNLQVSSGAEKRVPLRLSYSKYGSLLTEDNLICVAALLSEYSSDPVTAMRNIVLENPEIKIQILGEPKANRKLSAAISLQNPLPVPLTNCCFSVQGANLTGGHVISERVDSPVGPGQDAKAKIYFTPTLSGVRKLVVNFNSDKLCHVEGYRNIIIGN